MRKTRAMCWTPGWSIFVGTTLLAMTTFPSVQHGLAEETPVSSSRNVDFSRDIEPLFRSRCYSCHGPEEQESGLRLDDRRRALEGGDLGTVLVPGDSGQSRLIQIVGGHDDEIGIMPPDGEGTPLSTDEIALIRTWIDQGAIWPRDQSADSSIRHWSFLPIRRPKPPVVENGDWIRNPIDAFIAAKHAEHGIQPSKEADRTTLIRRIYLDVLGLPPSPPEVESFVDNASPRAYEQLIQDVLESEHYGERWGRHWLDLARYADSDGYEKDRPRPHAWRYRQWVIDALNADMPFDEFTIHQVAGDMLPDAMTDQRVASGFHRNTLHNTEGGTDKEEDRVKKTVDRTNTVSTIWLGLTMGCAQCHSHKYDPITQREYYAMYAFFNDMEEVEIPAPLPAELATYEKAKKVFDAEHARFQTAIKEYEKSQLAAAQSEWEKTALRNTTTWEPLELSSLKSQNGAELQQRSDHSVLATGKNVKSDVYTVEAVSPLRHITAIRLEVLPDPSLPKNGPGRSPNGNFVLTTLQVTAQPLTDAQARPQPVELLDARADYSQKGWDVSDAINRNPIDGWAVSNQFGKRHIAVFRTRSPIGFQDGMRLIVQLDQHYSGNEVHNLGRFRLSVTKSNGPIDLDGLPANVVQALAVPNADRSDKQQQVLQQYYRTIDPSLASLRAEAANHARKEPQSSTTKARAVQNRKEPRRTRIHIRGDFLNPGELVTASTPSILPPAESNADRANRLDLANWLMDDKNPLVARVVVNRIWQRYFGRGIVPTVDDFGAQGDPPSHPLLLDWLASELRDHDWRLKHIHQLILNSATYRQSAVARPDLDDLDPSNTLLARQQRLRVEAEIVRDLALSVSGLLETTVGGPSVRPPQPEDYSQLTYANSAKWVESKGADRYRRGLYTFFQRTSPYPMLMTFDAPDSTQCTAKRSTSNTPLQALTIWNDRVIWECAQHLGRRIISETTNSNDDSLEDATRARYAVQLCLARDPDPDELDSIVELYRKQKKICATLKEETDHLIGSAPVPQNTTRPELASWILVGRVLLNLDEFITRR